MTKNIKIHLPNVIDVTYAELNAPAVGLIALAALVPEQEYCITDFRVRHLIVGSLAVNGDVSLGDLYDTTVEPIIVRAATTSTLYSMARSKTYPGDVLVYDVNGTTYDANADRGWILRRHSVSNNVDIPCDWRNVKMRLWEDAAGSGVYVISSDNGFAYQDFPMFAPGSTNRDVYISAQAGWAIPTCVFKGSQNINVKLFGRVVHRTCFCDTIESFHVRGNFNDNVIYGWIEHVTYQGQVNGLLIGNIAQSVFGSHSGGINSKGVDISDCYFEKGQSLTFNKGAIGSITGLSIRGRFDGAIFSGDITDVEIDGAAYSGESGPFYFPEEMTGVTIAKGRSTAIGRMDWDWSADMATAQIQGGVATDIRDYAGIVNLYGDGGTFVTDRITSCPGRWPVRFVAQPDLADAETHLFTFTGTPLENLTAAHSGCFLWNGDIVLDSAKKDWIELELVDVVEPATSTTIRVWKEKARGIYV